MRFWFCKMWVLINSCWLNVKKWGSSRGGFHEFCSDPLTLWNKLSLYNNVSLLPPYWNGPQEKINSSLFPFFLSSRPCFSINRLFPGWLSRSGWVVGTSEALRVPGPPVVPIHWIWLRWAVFIFQFWILICNYFDYGGEFFYFHLQFFYIYLLVLIESRDR